MYHHHIVAKMCELGKESDGCVTVKTWPMREQPMWMIIMESLKLGKSGGKWSWWNWPKPKTDDTPASTITPMGGIRNLPHSQREGVGRVKGIHTTLHHLTHCSKNANAIEGISSIAHWRRCRANSSFCTYISAFSGQKMIHTLLCAILTDGSHERDRERGKNLSCDVHLRVIICMRPQMKVISARISPFFQLSQRAGIEIILLLSLLCWEQCWQCAKPH